MRYETSLTIWRGRDQSFRDWALKGLELSPHGALRLAGSGLDSEDDPFPPGAYHGGNFYTGSRFSVGAATSPVIETAFPIHEVVPSWNATTPLGTWIEVLGRVRIGERWSKWYNLGVWAAEDGPVRRHSVGDQTDTDCKVSTDVLTVLNQENPAAAFQITVRLFSSAGNISPEVQQIGAACANQRQDRGATSPGDPTLWDCLLPVPACSQMVYPNGGDVWCSPTSTSMILGYWRKERGACEARVRAAVAGIYDWIFDGYGNWPFNTAYAATCGMEACVTRFTGLDVVERWIAAGVPLAASIAWEKGDLTGAPISDSNGHLVVIAGFDPRGNPIVNDPAADSDADVQRTYARTEFERIWLKRSGGLVYLIYPPGWDLPR